MEIKIKYFDESIEKIEKISIGDWIDLRARKDISIPFMEDGMIPLNVAIELPKGYEAHIVPRSSTYKKWGIIQTNHVGIVDCSYCGDDDEWMMPVYSLRITGSVIRKGDRVCQFRIMKNQPKIEFIEVKELGNPNRNGFGSTGV